MRIFDECNILISYVIIDNGFKCCQDVLNENIIEECNILILTMYHGNKLSM